MSIQDDLVKSMSKELTQSSDIQVGDTNDIVKLTQDRMKIYRPHQEQFHKTWDENYTSYLIKYEPKMHIVPTRSQLFLPMSYSTVENWLTKVGSAFFSGDQLWTVLPSSPESIDLVNPTQSLLDYQTKIYKWKYLVYKILKATGIFGLSWTFFGWDVKIKNREIEVPRITEGGKVKIDKKIVPYIDQDKPIAVLAHPKEVFTDPRAEDVESAQVILREYWIDIDKVKDKIKKDIYDQPIKLEELADDTDAEMQKYNTLPLQGDNSAVRETYRKRIRVWECYEDERFYTLLNQRILARDKHNPLPLMRKPVMLVKDIDLPFSLNSMGEIDQVRNLNVEKNTTRNQRIDQQSLSINKMIAVDENAIIENQDMTSRPSGVIKLRTFGQDIRSVVMPFPQGDVSMSSYSEEGMLDKDAKEASGQQDYAVGIAPQRREAKGTVLSLQSKADSRFEITKVMPLMYQMADFPRFILMLDKTYLTGKNGADSIDVMVFDKRAKKDPKNPWSWEKIKLTDIDIHCDFDNAGSLGKALKQQRAQSLAQLMEQTMAYQQNLTAQGYPRFIDHAVLIRQWGKESEWGELMDKALIGNEQPNVAVSPQTMQKFVADQNSNQPNPQDVQASQQNQQITAANAAHGQKINQSKAAQDLAIKESMAKHKMAMELASHSQKMSHAQQIHQMEMQHMAEQMQAEQEAATTASPEETQ